MDLGRSNPPARGPAAGEPVGSSIVERIASRRVVLCVGPGGVGKTTCAAALALAAAKRGRRVLVLTIDPSKRLAQALGLGAQALREAVEIEVPSGVGNGTLHAMVLDTRAVFDDIVRSCATNEAAASTILEHPIYEVTVARLGGALEYAAMARVQMAFADGRYDLIVVDTPPTANAIDVLEAPGRVREVVTNPAARVLSGTGKLGLRLFGLGAGVLVRALSSIGGGAFLTDLGAFLSEFGSVLVEFQRRAGAFEALLASDRTSFVLMTAGSIFSVREARGFLDVLGDRKLHVDGVVLNKMGGQTAPVPDRATLVAGLVDGEAIAPERLEALRRMVEAHRVQARAAERAKIDLCASYPKLAIVTAPLLDPPPTLLPELLALGESLGREGT